ncbi:glycerophosphodiester phosphodiesterase family protein [Vreelandella populi]|uniref:Glycerophosphodiester phosphodiesterase n=1 Tax=Vreelandella populi TaxID=2498858 RepID=A0A3S0WQM8_9GAMM|nr:glycerophosphodiester phosphodiesterase family protein [Halomonas populi]RUR40694.1 glycerophosphodiester phosphodiesterase [Halomonas populi]RUR49200.1 glycerophosphodiester phosphodiesterase [Halomonas populi]RUR55691.1 glycerophosphodiester phosphodiesterase [Halomonas populi]
MQPLTQLGSALLRTLRDHLRPLIAYHLFFTLLASALLLPLIGWATRGLLAQLRRTVVTNDELISLLFSPLGLIGMLVVLGFTFLIIYWQQAGMLLVAVRPKSNHYRLAFEALWLSVRRLPALAGLVILQVGTHLLLLAPFMVALAWLYGMWLGGMDLYYLQRVKPPVLWYFIACALPLALAWMALAAKLYLRWLLALPLVALENCSPIRALKRSVHLTRGWHRSIGAAVLIVLLLVISLPIIATLTFDSLVTPLLRWLPEHNALLIPAMFAYLTSYLLLTLAITFIGIVANALLSACLYLQLAHQEMRPAPPSATVTSGRFAWAVELSVLLFAALQAWWILNSFELRDNVQVIAHRGSSMVAPENTLSAVEQALLDKADYVELDVRLTADNQVMIYHDRTLARLTGDNREFDDLTREELAQYDIGSWFGDAFQGEPIAGLDEVLTRVRGHAGLMIDMKASPGAEQTLADAVIDQLHKETDIRYACWAASTDAIVAHGQCGFPNALMDMRVATMSPALVSYIKTHAPELRVTLLAQLILPGTLDRRGFDALGLRHNRISEEEIRLAALYGYEVHAWTVNDRARMSTLIDLGVDAIITDYPDRLRELIEERHTLSDGELLLVKLRNWLRQ